ncbi:hypothetical protein ACMYYO_12925 [Dermacoccaceae bacterium W4C1]
MDIQVGERVVVAVDGMVMRPNPSDNGDLVPVPEGAAGTVIGTRGGFTTRRNLEIEWDIGGSSVVDASWVAEVGQV